MHSCMHSICAHLDSQSNLRLSTNSASPSDAWHWRILKAIRKAKEASSSWNSMGLAVFRAVIARSMLRSQVSACYNMSGRLFPKSRNLVRGPKIPTLAFPWLNSWSFGSPHLSRERSICSHSFFLLTHERSYRPPAQDTWLHLALASFTKISVFGLNLLYDDAEDEKEELKNSRRTPDFVIAKQGLAKPSTSWCPLQLPPANRIQAATLWI